jgi:hypothetical protein
VERIGEIIKRTWKKSNIEREGSKDFRRLRK